MVIIMSDDPIADLAQMQRFVAGTLQVEFAFTDKDACCRWIQHTLIRFRYMTASRPDKGLISCYLQQVSGYSSQQVKSLSGFPTTLRRRSLGSISVIHNGRRSEV